MTKILAITFQKMQNLTHNAFMHQVGSLLTDENMSSHGLENLIEPFNLALEAEDAAMRVKRKSSLTGELVKLNDEREEVYAGFVYHYESCLRHYNNDMRIAAQGISHIMKCIAYMHNRSNISRGGNIRKIIDNIRLPKYVAIVEMMQLDGWLNKLDELNLAYETISDKRFSEKAPRGSGNVRVARELTDKAYQAMVQRINALSIVNGPEEYSHFVRQLNTRIADEKRSIAIRDGWKKHKKEAKAEEADGKSVPEAENPV